MSFVRVAEASENDGDDEMLAICMWEYELIHGLEVKDEEARPKGGGGRHTSVGKMRRYTCIYVRIWSRITENITNSD